MLIYGALLFGGFALLYVGGELLIRGATGVGVRLGLSPILVGLVLVALGTSAPEMAVSFGAAVQGFGDMAVGNVVGSNVVNIALVLGLCAVIHRIPIGHTTSRRHLPALVVLTLVALLFLADGYVGRPEGLVLLIGMLGVMWWSMRGAASLASETVDDNTNDASMLKVVVLLLTGIALLVSGAEAVIYGGAGLARAWGVSEAVIALSLTAFGTSLPEIAASLIAVSKRQYELAVGNIVGSNLLNIGIVLAISALLMPVTATGIGFTPLAIFVGLTLLFALLAWTKGAIARPVGIGLLIGYGVYCATLLS